MEETYFYCQGCDGVITVDQLALLNEGKCPHCHEMIGFSTVRKDEHDGFEQVTMLNESEMLKEVLGEE